MSLYFVIVKALAESQDMFQDLRLRNSLYKVFIPNISYYLTLFVLEDPTKYHIPYFLH